MRNLSLSMSATDMRDIIHLWSKSYWLQWRAWRDGSISWSTDPLYRRIQPKYIINIKSEESIFQHWFAELAQLEFTAIHKTENVNVDALSRSDNLYEPTKIEYEEYQIDNKVGDL